MAQSFRGKSYSGLYCGATAFTIASAMDNQMLFYTIVAPIISMFGDFGFNTLMRYEHMAKVPR